jgi:hypothetical protein
MNNLSSRSVVDQMVSQLTERRTTRISRRTAYTTLVQAILNDPSEHVLSLDRQPTPIHQDSVAA